MNREEQVRKLAELCFDEDNIFVEQDNIYVYEKNPIGRKFQPFTDLNDAVMCLEKVAHQKLKTTKWTNPDEYRCIIIDLGGRMFFGRSQASLPEAICEAVLEAIGEKDV
jgi:hypothetical protein